jgi:hypothetical protein
MPTIQPRTATVTIYQGDYLDEIAFLRRKVEAAQEAEKSDPAPRLLSEIPESLELVRKHDALVAEAEANAITVKLRSVGRRAYHDLMVKHPPRTAEDVPAATREADADLGRNQDAFFEDLVPLSMIEPSFENDTDRQRFLEDLPAVDWERIKWAAYSLNEVATADPKLFPASRLTQQSDET